MECMAVDELLLEVTWHVMHSAAGQTIATGSHKVQPAKGDNTHAIGN